jgi:DNA polymerase I-like protein with 3'-5' exonuclease and polymerase domains
VYDGRIGAGRTGIAATHRQKHKVVVNVPKADPKVLLGYEFRELWIAEDGYLIAAGDAAALEGRVQGHYTHKYDDGATADELLKGDVHSKNANAFYGSIYDEVAAIYNSPDFDKENPKWKPYRNKSKNGFYAILYGAAAPKVASTLGIPEQYGKEALEAFWAANPGTAELKKSLEKYWESVGKKKYLPAIDGRILLTRKKSALLNTIFQSCGGISMDYAGCFMDVWLGGLKFDEKRRPYYLYKNCIVRRIGYFHDELEYECQEEVAEEVSHMIEKAISKAGTLLKIKVPLVGEGKVGKNWKEVH